MENTEIWTITEQNNEEGTWPWAGIYNSLDEAKHDIKTHLAELYETEADIVLLNEFPIGNGNQRDLVFEHEIYEGYFHVTQHVA